MGQVKSRPVVNNQSRSEVTEAEGPRSVQRLGSQWSKQWACPLECLDQLNVILRILAMCEARHHTYYSGQTSFDKYKLSYSSRSIKTEQPLRSTAVINRNTTPLVFMPVVKQSRSKCVHVSHLVLRRQGRDSARLQSVSC